MISLPPETLMRCRAMVESEGDGSEAGALRVMLRALLGAFDGQALLIDRAHDAIALRCDACGCEDHAELEGAIYLARVHGLYPDMKREIA